MLKIAMIGTGAMAEKHSQTLSRHAGADLSVICSTERSAPKANRFQQDYGYQRTVTDFAKILDDDEVEAVYICSPDATHPSFTAQALAAGKHVFCEKPLARNQRGFEIVREALKKHDCRLQIGMNCRYREQYSLPKTLADSGELGGLRFLRGTYLLNKVAVAKSGQKAWWREHPSEVMFFLHANGIHIIDLMRWYGGRVTSVFARATGFELGQDFRADTFSASLEFANGAIGEVLISSSAFQPRDVGLQAWYELGSILGTRVYRRSGEDISEQSEELEVNQPILDLALQFNEFRAAIAERRDPMNNFHEAFANFRLLHAIERSLAQNSVVHLDELVPT